MLRIAWRFRKDTAASVAHPYLRWRIETYSGMHADRITRGVFRFAWRERRELIVISTGRIEWIDENVRRSRRSRRLCSRAGYRFGASGTAKKC